MRAIKRTLTVELDEYEYSALHDAVRMLNRNLKSETGMLPTYSTQEIALEDAWKALQGAWNAARETDENAQ